MCTHESSDAISAVRSSDRLEFNKLFILNKDINLPCAQFVFISFRFCFFFPVSFSCFLVLNFVYHWCCAPMCNPSIECMNFNRMEARDYTSLGYKLNSIDEVECTSSAFACILSTHKGKSESKKKNKQHKWRKQRKASRSRQAEELQK